MTAQCVGGLSLRCAVVMVVFYGLWLMAARSGGSWSVFSTTMEPEVRQEFNKNEVQLDQKQNFFHENFWRDFGRTIGEKQIVVAVPSSRASTDSAFGRNLL